MDESRFLPLTGGGAGSLATRARRKMGRIAEVDGFAVRRQWPDGSHDYFRLSRTPGEAQEGLEADQRYWQPGPIRPVEHRVVAISSNDFELHRSRRRCRSPDCP